MAPGGYISLTVLSLFVRDLVVIFHPSDKAQVDEDDILGDTLTGDIGNITITNGFKMSQRRR